MPGKTRKCPFCGVEVNREKFTRHLRRVHADEDEEKFREKGISKPVIDDTKKKDLETRKKAYAERRKKKILAILLIIFVCGSVGGVIIYQEMNTPGGLGGLISGKDIAVMETSMGVIKIKLYTDKAPITTRNFINLAKSGFYNGLIFHRVVQNFVIQGGGYTPTGEEKKASTIPWENTGYKNTKYTIAMARAGDADDPSYSGTASSQFFINLKDNPSLDAYRYPYVVFGVVIEGQSVVDAIGALPTGTHNGMQDWPLDPPVIRGIVIQ